MSRPDWVIVTGASGKLGVVMTGHLVSQGWKVLAITRTEESAGRLREAHTDSGNLKCLSIDLQADSAIPSLLDHLDSGQGVYGIIHNARSLSSLKISEQGIAADEDFHAELSMAVTIPYRLTCALQEHGLQRVIFISSQYGVVSPNPGLYEDGLLSSPIQYGVSKAAQIQLSKELSVRLAPHGTLVNAIALGGVQGRVDKEFETRYSNMLPLGRMLQEQELLPAIDFLLDPRNTATTGSVLTVDGGWTVT
ncbi:MAG: SDR family oxidoreductase [Mariniblastus sp.]|nr:SDR family oxidoreductase [Mariniblastus sp.]